MNKSTLKKVILATNECSLECDNKDELLKEVKQKTQLSKRSILSILQWLEDIHMLEWIEEEVDLFPAAVIFARSKPNTLIEALSLWEMCGKNNEYLDEFQEVYQEPNLYEYMERIKNEEPQIISTTLSILYTDSLYHKDSSIPYKNEDFPVVDLKDKDFLYQIIPRKGIPTNRDISKDLQIHFKDTLMHEFDKTCPICKIHLPRMLIGSHIKPFRDCGHIFEAADHNNGLLLCRNHDYLFDQGFISYNDEGKLLISPKLKHPEHYALDDLDQKYMTTSRKLYMEYHRNHIFQSNK